jgi:hypothetical protein
LDRRPEWAACDLIDKEIEGTITPEEAEELRGLQDAMLRYRRLVAPVPLEDEYSGPFWFSAPQLGKTRMAPKPR